MTISENKEGYAFAKDRYVFAERYGEQLESALQGALAFSISPFNGFYVETTKTGETAKTIIRKTGIKFCESLLPRHCNPELIEEALAALQSAPDNIKLLEVLGEYAKNDLFEQQAASYTTALFGTLIYLFLFFSVLSTFPLLPIYIALISLEVCLMGFLTSGVAFLVASIVLGDNIRGLKFGRWVGDLIKGNSREPANLTKLNENLTALINECKTKETVEEVANEQTKTCQLKEDIDLHQVTEEVTTKTQPSRIYPSLVGFYPSPANGFILAEQATASNTHRSTKH